MIKELDTVVVTQSFNEHGLQEGDVGTVVHPYSDGEAYEVEFMTAQGKTVALLTLDKSEVRPMADSEILHVREYSPA